MKNLIVRTFKSLLQLTWDIVRILILCFGNVLMLIGKTLCSLGAVLIRVIGKYGHLAIVIAWSVLYTLFVLNFIRTLRHK